MNQAVLLTERDPLMECTTLWISDTLYECIFRHTEWVGPAWQ